MLTDVRSVVTLKVEGIVTAQASPALPQPSLIVEIS